MTTKTIRVPINPRLLRWARQRARLDVESMKRTFPKIEAWEQGEIQPTLRQLERFAQKTHVPFGFLFLDVPPEEPLPIPDFRTMPGPSMPPSPDLLETIYLCQQRQEWYRNYLKTFGEKPLPFVGVAKINDDPVKTAADIRHYLHFDIEERKRTPTWAEALRRFIEQVERVGILVMSSGVVGSNTHRKLSVEEFRGFALVDEWAPVIFINAADSKAARMFTLAHELAHVWLGESGVSNSGITIFPDENVERWCNQVAAELLVPFEVFTQVYHSNVPLREGLDNLARHFKVSTLVILRRTYEMGYLGREEFRKAYGEEVTRLRRFERRGEGGGDFYRTLSTRISKPFAQAVVTSVLEGQTLFRDAFRMLGIRKQKTFHRIAQALGVA